MSSLWSWIGGFASALLLLLVLWLVYRGLKFRRLWVTASEYLAVPDVEAALQYIDDNPLLFTLSAEYLISTLLDRAWARGDMVRYVSGALRLSFLVGCRDFGVETARQMGAQRFQASMDAVDSSSWQRALKLLEQLVTRKEMSIPEEEVDEELVEAMSRIMDLLRPSAANQETAATMDAILDTLHQILQQKTGRPPGNSPTV